MADQDEKKKKEAPEEDDPFAIPEVDESEPVQQFERPKWLMNLKQAEKPAEVDLKSGSASAKPPPLETPAPRPAIPPKVGTTQSRAQNVVPRPTPTPESAQVRADKPISVGIDQKFLEALSRTAEEANIRTHKPAPPPPEAMRHLQPPGEFDVKADQEKRARPSLQPLEGPVEIVKQVHDATKPKPTGPSPTIAPGEVQVVVDTHAKHPMSEKLKVTKPRKAIGIVDTTFARYNMGNAAMDELTKIGGEYDIVRRTVPGIKDLAVECKILFDEEDCDLVIACGMVGGAPIDKQCAHEASLAIQWAMLSVNRHILEVFVHEDEAKGDERQLAWLMDRRTREHALNAYRMLLAPHELAEQAGQGLRQGFDDAGPARMD